jgi:hypothetical protein
VVVPANFKRTKSPESGIDDASRGASNRCMRHTPDIPDPQDILRGADRDLSRPMHTPSELPDLEVDLGLPQPSWFERLLTWLRPGRQAGVVTRMSNRGDGGQQGA